MALTTKLELRQGQQLVMTPQLQQAIRLLQFSSFELAQYVESELERNPLLERDEATDSTAKDPAPKSSEEDVSGEAQSQTTAPLDLSATTSDGGAALDTDFENVFQDTSPSELPTPQDSGWSTLRQSNSGFSDDRSNLEEFVSGELSLKDHLSQQLPLALSDASQRIVGQHLIDMIDEAGYLNADFDQLADKLGAPRDMIDAVVATLQTLDPPGVFAGSLAECLALQLKEQNRYDAVIAKLLDNLHLLGTHDLAKLRRTIGVDQEELAEMVAEIQQLDPKPGLRFGSVQVQTVVPDITVRPASDGSWFVELNSDTLPRVLVNRSYYTTVSQNSSSESDKTYLLECLQTANWLVKSLDQRARTILRVAEELVRQQDAFFAHGVQHLKPLNLKTVADAISMHESTVSRVTSNKYMATPRGIFELKYFFTSAIQSSGDGDAFSSEAVRFRIKQMIDAETDKKVLSDDKIV
ncbi:MAG: RNA polymerase factor sigma-54, partial [Alphaproteobacteria bacterium]|nr:RNA polymerase factor sigma-54 [Alphaproteobacteria bacterium]